MGDDKRTLWCGNLSDKVTEAILYELFLQAGPLQRVTIPLDREGRQRSYAFITYKDECSVPYALKMFEDTRLFNRVLALSMKGGKVPDSLERERERGANGLSYGHDRRIDMATSPMVSKDESLDFNMLLQLGQQMMAPAMNLISAPFTQMMNMMNFPMYSSQMGDQSYLGGSMANSKSSNHGYQHSRNHPYASPGMGSPGGNHGHNGYRSNSRNNNMNYRHGGRY